MNHILKLLFIFLLFISSLYAKELEKVSIQLQWLDQFQFAGYYIAKEKGFYEDVGLDVEIKKYSSKVNVVDEVISKRATYGVGRSSLLLDKSNGADIVLILAAFQSSPSVIIARKDSGIDSIKDFKGKRIMVTSDVTLAVSILAMQNKYSISHDDFIVQQHSYNIDDLINKNTDLMSSYISNEPYLMKEKGVEVTIFDPKKYGFDFYSDLLFTSNDELKAHKQRVIEFKNASIKGWNYAFKHISESVEIILKNYNEQNKSKEALLYEAKELKKLAYFKTKNLGYIDKYKLQRTYDIYNVMSFLKKPIDLDSFVFYEDKNSIHLTKEERAYLKIHSVIKAHNEFNWPPFNYYENNIAKGFSVDYMNMLAKKLHVEVEYVRADSWSELMEMLQTKELDVLINVAKNRKRAKMMAFTDKFYTAYNAIYVNKNNKNFNSLQELSGKTIAIPKKFFTQELLAKYYPSIKQILVKNQLEALRLLSLGKVDAVIGKKVILDSLIERKGISSISASNYVEDDRVKTNLRLGVAKSDKILRNILQKAKDVIGYKEMEELKKKWFGAKNSREISTIKLTKREKKYIDHKKELLVCVGKDRLPYGAIKDDKFVGLSADFIKLYAQKLSIKVKFLKQSEEKKCDIKPIMFTYIKTKLSYRATKPYFKDSISLVTRIEQPFIQNLNNLADKKLISLRGFDKLLRKINCRYLNIDIETLESIDNALKLVASRKAFGFIGISLVSSHYIQNKFSTELKIVNSFKNFGVGLGVTDREPILLNILNKAINDTTQFQKSKILNKWISTTVESKKDYSYVWKMLVVFFIVTSILAYFYIKQKKLKDKLQAFNDTLEQRVKTEVAHNREKDQYLFHQSRLAQMGEMLSMIAHQWRQPLTAISATTGNLKFKIMQNDINKDFFEKEIELIDDYSQHLSGTINDFRDFFKNNKIKEKTTLEEVVHSTLSIVQTSIENQNITIKTDLTCNKILETYPNELKQVLLNLIKNAEDVLLENSIKNPTITIETTCKEKTKVLIVKDNGIGISTEISDKIFDPYFSTKKEKDGTGLGLYISKTIIEEHCGGVIHVKSNNKGAIFTIEI